MPLAGRTKPLSDTNIHALPIGHTFDGYRILRLLGAGGFGITYLAEEVQIGRKVAIKEYLPQGFAARAADSFTVRAVSSSSQGQFAWGLDRFRKEASTLVAFEHPNIVSVYRYFEANGTAYLVMQYVEGKPLDALISGGKTLAESEIEEVILPILDGLEQVHAAHFLHRDIKPANIYIRKDGRPVLLDFGAARQAFGSESKSITAIVSEGYAPFEQYEAKGDQRASTDIYAIGAVLYRCITGDRPPAAPERVSARLRGTIDPMKPAREAGKGRYSERLLEATDRALSTMPDDRPQNIGEIRALLKGDGSSRIASQALPSHSVPPSRTTGGAATIAPVSDVPVSGAPPRKSRVPLLAGGAVAVGAAAIAAYFLLAPQSPPPGTAATPSAPPTRVSAVTPPRAEDEAAERAAKEAEQSAEADLAAIRESIRRGEYERVDRDGEITKLEDRIALALSKRSGHAGLQRVMAATKDLRIDLHLSRARHHFDQARAALRENRYADGRTALGLAWLALGAARQSVANAAAEPQRIKQLLEELSAFGLELERRIVARVKELAEGAEREAARNYDEARRLVAEAERLDPAAAKAARERVEAIRGRAEDDRERRERVQRHIKLADYHFEQARTAAVEGRLAEARSVAEQAKVQLVRAGEALRSDPAPASLKDLSRELDAFQRDLARRIAARLALLLREARDHIREGKLDDVQKRLDEAAELEPASPDLASARRELEEARKKPAAPPDPDAAERERTKSVVKAPVYDARGRRGAAYFAFGDRTLDPQALAYLQRGADAAKAEANALLMLACSYDQLEVKDAAEGRKLAQARCETAQQEAARRGAAAARIRIGYAAPGKGPEFRRVAFAVQSEKPPEAPKPPEAAKAPEARPGALQLMGRTARLSRISSERRAVMRIEMQFGAAGALSVSCSAEAADGGQTACFGQRSGGGRWSLNGATLCISSPVINLPGNACYEVSGSGNQYRLSGGGLLAGALLLQ